MPNVFDTYSEYRQAILEALGRAARCVVLIDPDLRSTGLESTAGIAALEAFCARAHREDALRIVLHSPDFLEREAPRLLAMAAGMGHRIRFRLSSTAYRNWDRPFMACDGRHLVERFHQDGPRGDIRLDDVRAASAATAQFETIWTAADPGPRLSPLGI